MRCKARKIVRATITLGGKKVVITGEIRCRKQIKAHELNPKLPHGGEFNKRIYQWKAISEEVE